MKILLIESSTEYGLLAWCEQRHVIDSRRFPSEPHSPSWMPFLEDLLIGSRIPEFIGVGIGPGSYTGIRNSVALAQALSLGWNCPIVAIPSPETFQIETESPFLVLFDAKLGGIYCTSGKIIKKKIEYDAANLLSLEEVYALLTPNTTVFTPHTDKLCNRFKECNLTCTGDWKFSQPSAEQFLMAVEIRLSHRAFLPAGSSPSPLYLRASSAELNRRAVVNN